VLVLVLVLVVLVVLMLPLLPIPAVLLPDCARSPLVRFQCPQHSIV
jgi:hypothetical protein